MQAISLKYAAGTACAMLFQRCNSERNTELVAPDIDFVEVIDVYRRWHHVGLEATKIHQIAKIGCFDVFAIFAKANAWVWRAVEAEVCVEDNNSATAFSFYDSDTTCRDVIIGTREGSCDSHFGLVTVTFRSLNSFMRPFVRMPRGFSRGAMSDVGVDYKSH